MQLADNERQFRRRNPERFFDSLSFAQRLQAGGAFTREQAEGLAGQIYAAIWDATPEPPDLKTFMDAGFTQQQAGALIQYTADYAALFRGVPDIETRIYENS